MAKKELAPFEEWPFRVPKLEAAQKKMRSLTENFKDAPDGPSALKAYKAFNRYMDKIGDDMTHISVLYSLETANKKYVKAAKKVTEIQPLIQVESLAFMKAFVSSSFRPYLEEKLGTFIFKMYEYALKGFDERIVNEAQKDGELTMKYDALIASILIEFDGKQYNLPQMGKLLTNPDRDLRKRAALAYYAALEEKKDEIEDIYDQLVKIRTEMAHKLGYKSYTELAYINMNRFDYTPIMVASYRQQILEEVTPIAAKLYEEQRKRLGLKKLEYYDLGLAFKNGNPLPKGTTEEKVLAAQKMYDELSEDTSFFFKFMRDHHLMFLDAKPGKQSGGYMTYFPVHECPIIFSNFNGTSGDVDVLTHEFGHSFQAYMSRNIKVNEYRQPTMESCEIHSMSMEFFAEPYMDRFFDEPDKYRYVHLADAITFLPYGVSVDEFQHWVYDNPEATPAMRDQKWHEIECKYTPWKVKAEEDCPYLYSGHRWLTQGHIFSSPFYYIDYTLAQVCAFQFFNLDRKNHSKAWKKYIKLCKLGGKYPFCELLKQVGLKVPFDEGVLHKTIKPLVKVLKEYHPENF